MAVDDDPDDPDADEAAHDAEEAAVERPVRLNDQRMAAVLDALRGAGARTVVDLGCGEGRLVRKLLREPWVDRVVGVDVSWRALEFAARRLQLDEMPPRQRERVELRQGALTYRDRKLGGFDAATVVEVIEHLDPPRLAAFERVVFLRRTPAGRRRDDAERRVQRALRDAPRGHAAPPRPPLRVDARRVRGVGDGVGERHGYRVEFGPVGNDDPEVGPPTQMAVFRR